MSAKRTFVRTRVGPGRDQQLTKQDTNLLRNIPNRSDPNSSPSAFKPRGMSLSIMTHEHDGSSQWVTTYL